MIFVENSNDFSTKIPDSKSFTFLDTDTDNLYELNYISFKDESDKFSYLKTYQD